MSEVSGPFSHSCRSEGDTGEADCSSVIFFTVVAWYENVDLHTYTFCVSPCCGLSVTAVVSVTVCACVYVRWRHTGVCMRCVHTCNMPCAPLLQNCHHLVDGL